MTKLKIIKASSDTGTSVIMDFYQGILDGMIGNPYRPLWRIGSYPSSEIIDSAIKNGELYIGYYEQKMVSSMIINNHVDEGYEGVKWGVSARPEEVTSIHLLGVSPEHMGKGIGRSMMTYAIDRARKAGQKAVRIDTIHMNDPAHKLYIDMGFKLVESKKLSYSDVLTYDFLIFEYII